MTQVNWFASRHRKQFLRLLSAEVTTLPIWTCTALLHIALDEDGYIRYVLLAICQKSIGLTRIHFRLGARRSASPLQPRNKTAQMATIKSDLCFSHLFRRFAKDSRRSYGWEMFAIRTMYVSILRLQCDNSWNKLHVGRVSGQELPWFAENRCRKCTYELLWTWYELRVVLMLLVEHSRGTLGGHPCEEVSDKVSWPADVWLPSAGHFLITPKT